MQPAGADSTSFALRPEVNVITKTRLQRMNRYSLSRNR